MKFSQTAKILDLNARTCRRIILKHRSSDSVENKERSGRQNVTGRRYSHRFQILPLAECFETSPKLRSKLVEQVGIWSSERLERRRLKHDGLKGCVENRHYNLPNNTRVG